MDTKAYRYRQEAMKRWILLFIVSLFPCFPCLCSAYMPLPRKDITTKAEDTWDVWMTPEECTIKAEDIKVGFLKTDDFMTTAVVTKEDKVPMAATTTKAADIKVV